MEAQWVMKETKYNGVKVFSATKARDREHLDEAVTHWLRTQNHEVVDVQVRQSSDADYHCLSIVLFYRRKAGGVGW